jgi:histidinol-phosphate aminotransferase
VVLANPNAPTGCLLSGEALERILSYDPSRLVLIDEAYADFGEGTAVSLLAEYPNLLVVRTFSKSYSLAGLRVGYAVGSPDLTEGLARIRDCFNSYTVDTTAQLLAAAALRDDAYFTDCRDTLIRTRERTAAALREMGFDLTESKGNFLWAGLPGTGGEEIYTALRKEGILIRYFRQPRTADHVRITVGRPEEMETLIECLRTFIRNR